MVQQPKTDLGRRIDDISSSHTIMHTSYDSFERVISSSQRLQNTTNETEESVSSVGIFIFLLFSFVYVNSFDITEQVTLLTRFACGHKHVA